MNEHTLKLFDYHLWANDRVFRHLKEIPQEKHHQEIQSVFPSLYEALVHMYLVDNVWLAAMSGESDQMTAVVNRVTEETKEKSVEQLEPLFNYLSQRYKAFFERQPDLQAFSTYRHPHYGALDATYCDILQHIVNHGTYHRGNITAMLRQIGHPGVPTDYIHYLYYLSEK